MDDAADQFTILEEWFDVQFQCVQHINFGTVITP